MRDSDWLNLSLRLIFLICVQTQNLCNGALMWSVSVRLTFWIQVSILIFGLETPTADEAEEQYTAAATGLNKAGNIIAPDIFFGLRFGRQGDGSSGPEVRIKGNDDADANYLVVVVVMMMIIRDFKTFNALKSTSFQAFQITVETRYKEIWYNKLFSSVPMK